MIYTLVSLYDTCSPIRVQAKVNVSALTASCSTVTGLVKPLCALTTSTITTVTFVVLTLVLVS